MRIIKTRFSEEDRYKILLVLVWTRTILTSYVYQFLLRIPILNQVADGIKTTIYIIAIIFALDVILKRQKIVDVIFGLTCIVGYFINMDLFPRSQEYLMDNIVKILFIAVPAYYIGTSMNKDEYIDLLYKWSRICLCAILIYFMVFGFKAEEGRKEVENMGIAYRILPHLIMVLLYTLNEKRKSDIILSVIGMVLLLACGTRGAVIGVAAFLGIYILLFYHTKQKWIAVGILAVSSVLMLLNIEVLINPLTAILQHFGFSTRVVNALQENEIFYDNGRSQIVYTMMRLLKENNYRAMGLAGDRNIVWWMAYSHNIVLELWVTFGIYMGSAFFGIICFIIIRALLGRNYQEKGFIVSLIFGGSFFKLFFTSSFLLEYQFFFLIGYCVCVIRKEKRLNNECRLLR